VKIASILGRFGSAPALQRLRGGRVETVCRVVAITATVFRETKAASRAAALSFSSLLGLGPLVAISVIAASLVLGQRDPRQAVDALNRMLHFVAPQLREYEKLNTGGAGTSSPGVDLNPQAVGVIDHMIANARTGAGGTLGALLVIAIALLLFDSIENAFNEIWGVRESRSLMARLARYWTALTLGAVLFFAAVTLPGAGAFAAVFTNHLPFAADLARTLQWTLPLVSFALLVAVLTLFYRLVPNTRVHWIAAAAGGLVVAVALMLNNFLAFLYLDRVVMTQDLYGSLALLPVLMFGLYIFWLCVLIGGQVSYAVQNVNFRKSQAAWSNLAKATQERLALAVLIVICRRFQRCQSPLAAPALAEIIKLPTHVLNLCLNRLVDMGLLIALPSARRGAETPYQPARPLNRIHLADFKRKDESLGDDPLGRALDGIDPLMPRYNRALEEGCQQEFLNRNLEELFAESPVRPA
jgi:membrane protein